MVSFFGNKIELKDTPQLDAFSRLRVSQANTIFDSQQEYGLQTSTIWDASANGTFAAASTNGSASSAGNAVGPTNSNTRMTPVTVSTTANHYAVLQSRQYSRYIPGKSHLILMTGVYGFTSGTSARIVLRTSTSGSVSDSNQVEKADWNIDPLDGTGPSGKTLDLTKTQILFIQAQWLGVGRVVVGFDIDGILVPVHQFLNANSLTVPYTQTFNLPVRYEMRNTTTTTSARVGYFDAYNGCFLEVYKTGVSPPGGTINAVCCSVQSEGGEESRGFPRSANTGTSAIAVTTRRPVLSIRAAALFNTLTNRCQIEMADYRLLAGSNSSLYEIVIGGTLTGAAWATVGAASAAEYDITATAITGGTTVISDYVLSGSGSTKGESSGLVDIRSPLVISKIDGALNTQTPISIVCTSLSGTSNINAAMNWHEQQV